MLSRRLVRVKVLQMLYARLQSDEQSIDKTEKELFFSLNKCYELYHYLLLLLTDIVHYAEMRMDIGRQKNFPTSEELNPNLKFVGNIVIRSIADSNMFQKYIFENKISWSNYPGLIKVLYKEILNSDGFNQHMQNPERSVENDRKLVKFVLRQIFARSEDLTQALEEKSIYWNDELEFVISLIIELLSGKDNDHTGVVLLEPYDDKNEDNFAKRLLRQSIINHDHYRAIINPHIENWNIERMALIDILIIQLAITELIEFPFIPVKVTLNEYIEIARFYSTEKSGQFINGILDKVIEQLKSEGKIKKRGKGLRGEI